MFIAEKPTTQAKHEKRMMSYDICVDRYIQVASSQSVHYGRIKNVQESGHVQTLIVPPDIHTMFLNMPNLQSIQFNSTNSTQLIY